MSQAEELFQQISEAPESPVIFIEQMVARRERETDYLDFKSGADLEGDDKPTRTDARRIWSEALSGFANTGGGVLVYGVKASRIKDGSEFDGIDAAYGVDPLKKPRHFAQRLQDQVLEACVPHVRGVRIEPLLRADGRGYVICLVPESRNKPHRGRAAHDAYYQRIGDSFAVIPHALLRDLFYPRVVARVRPSFSVSLIESAEHPLRVHVQLENDGDASARSYAVSLNMTPGCDRPRKSDLATKVYGGSSGEAFSALYEFSRPLHPGQMNPLGQFEYKLRVPDKVTAARTGIRDVTRWLHWIGEIQVTLTVFAENQAPERWRVVLKPDLTSSADRKLRHVPCDPVEDEPN